MYMYLFICHRDKEEEMRELKLQENGQDNKKDDGSGPWKLKNSSPVPEETKVTETEKRLEKKEEERKEKSKAQLNTTKRYVPPQLRARSMQPLEPVQMSAALRKSAPEIDNDKDFPSLGGCA